MDRIQLMVKDADEEGIEKWVMSIYYPDKEEESQDFIFEVSEEDEGNIYLDFRCDDYEALEPFILRFSASSYLEVVVGRYTYSKNREEIEKLKAILENMLPCCGLEDTEYGIALYNEHIREELGLAKVLRKVEIITV